MAGEHERGRIFAVNGVKCGGIEIHRGIMREYHGVVAGLAGIDVKTRKKTCRNAENPGVSRD